MKKMLLAAAAASAVLATPAMAATDATYDVKGTVATVCSINASGSLDFGALYNAGNFSPATANPSSTDSAAFCNAANTKITVTHTDPSVTSTSPGFDNTFQIVSKVTTPQNTTGFTGDVSEQKIGAFSALTVSVTANAPNNKLVAGDYNNGKINITLTPVI